MSVEHLAERVRSAAVTLVAACHGRPAAEAAELARLIPAAPQALEVLTVEDQADWLAVAEIVIWEAGTVVGGTVFDLNTMPSESMYADSVRDLLDECRTLAGTAKVPSNPAAFWLAAVEEVQRHRARQGAVKLVRAIDDGASVAEVVDSYRRIEPPTARKGEVRARSARTAAQVAAEAAEAAAGTPKLRFSSGLRTLDLWVTNSQTDEPLGFIAPGEGVVVAAGTGQGKSSFSYGLVPALAQDMVNWGRRDAKVLFCHTEEASADKVRYMRLGPGQRFHHLANNVIVADVGSSREAFMMAVYDQVIDAARQSRETGRPITDFLLDLVVLDYLQSLSGEGENNLVDSTFRTAELILRGIQRWDPEEMRKWSKVDFATYAGMAWPTGMENHRVATVSFAQLVKAAGNGGPYRPGAKNAQLSDYTVLDANGDAVWQPKEGDQPVLGKKEIYGSSVILNNATFIVFLHRSNIFSGIRKGPDGKVHLDDTRARFVIDKMRNGAVSNVVPVKYDSSPEGTRGHYYDPLAEEAVAQGRFTPDGAWRGSGDPILPVRPSVRPLAGYRY